MKTKRFIKIVSVISSLAVLATFSGCQTIERNLKTVDSEFSGGLDRTITVYDYSGNVIKSYDGKCDIETNDNKVLFDINGKRIVIYNAIVIAEEK